MGNISILTLLGYIFVVAVTLFILISIFRLARSFYRYRKRHSKRNDAQDADNQQNSEQ
ncbi:MAG: hypothetical protein LBS01_09280 [Prevotellaceae bacterium]|jgi:biopolymer transport protein ExbB/TolQ|nr:hypothetical protein [Prevotellaceae bacterium]